MAVSKNIRLSKKEPLLIEKARGIKYLKLIEEGSGPKIFPTFIEDSMYISEGKFKIKNSRLNRTRNKRIKAYMIYYQLIFSADGSELLFKQNKKIQVEVNRRHGHPVSKHTYLNANLDWNGKNANGESLLSGNYLCKTYASLFLEKTGGRGRSWRVATTIPESYDFELDDLKPELASIFPKSETYVATEDIAITLTFNKSLSTETALNTSNYVLESKDKTILISEVKGQDEGPYALILNQALSSGDYNLTISNLGDHNGFEIATIHHAINIDIDIPDIILAHPVSDSWINSSNIIVEGCVTDYHSGIDIEEFEISLNGKIQEGFVFSGNRFSLFLESLPEGNHTLSLIAKDKVGNLRQLSSSFSVDVNAPLLNITNPDMHDLVFTTTTPTFTGTFYDQNGIETFGLELNGNVLQNIEFTDEGFSVTLHDIADGTHLLAAQVFDKAGNSSYVDRVLHIDLSTPPPYSGNTLNDWSVSTIVEGINPQHVRVTDVNLDGKNDIIYKEINDGKVYIIYQN